MGVLVDLERNMKIELSKRRISRLLEIEAQITGKDMVVEECIGSELSKKYADLHKALGTTIQAEAKYLAEI